VTDPAKLSGIKVKAKVIEEGKNKKVLVFKRKSKKDYQKAFGHRQPYSLVEVGDIVQKTKSPRGKSKEQKAEEKQEK